ncbi:hypothetical protein B0T45_16700 [Chromobacterium haemolyticum]|uniref:Morphogenetic protein n=1 Tax=Chromobacterium haemolyticum TaxID=394935 RepID=A0A1W0CMU2_9NEIS|nr:hypothetical protein B0T45_16700 [Chromobacterium haemolyticum]
MKEKPIPFHGDMIRALLAGTKTQTRRIIKPQPDATEERLRELGAWIDGFTLSQQVDGAWQHGFIDAKCPYGQPGDRLWVRETYTDAGCRLTYRADEDDGAHCVVEKWIPLIHMPRAACRLVLEITEVRVERLQDISNEDCIAEGINRIAHGREGYFYHHQRTEPDRHNWCHPDDAYKELWESLYGAGSWDANPWVWVIEFKKVEA